MTHIPFSIPTDPMYVPLQVGAALSQDLGYLKDNSGDHISHLNPYYAELSGMYWVWKNCNDLDYVGICHYRRFLLNDSGFIFTKEELESTFHKYQIITSKKLELNFSYYYGFQENHTLHDLEVFEEVLKKVHPQDLFLYQKRVQENHTYFGNLMICSKSLFDQYCQWLFPIFEEMHKKMDFSSYDNYHKRLYGFFSEFLLMIWCEKEQLSVKECKVGMIGEKKETAIAKQTFASFFQKKEIFQAKSYFLDLYQKRPDILMEASDITGELHLCLQAISIAEHELDAYGNIIFPISIPFSQLMGQLRLLNKCILHELLHKETKEEYKLLHSSTFSPKALEISRILVSQQLQKQTSSKPDC